MGKKQDVWSGWICDGLSKSQAEAVATQLRIDRASARSADLRDNGNLTVEVREIASPVWYGVYCTAATSAALYREACVFATAARWAFGQRYAIDDADEKHMEEYRAQLRRDEADAQVI